MKEEVRLNNDESQILLWVRSYPGITEKVFEEKKLDYDLRLRVKPTLNSLKTKGFITDMNGEWYPIKEIELPC